MARKSNDLKDYNNIDLLYPSKYLKGIDLGGKEVTFTIEGIEPRHELHRADNTKDYKPVVSFKGQEKRWVMNKTNAERIAAMYGPEATGWVGKAITLRTEKVRAFGKTHDALRVKEQKPSDKPDADDPPLESVITQIECIETLEDLLLFGDTLKNIKWQGDDRATAIKAFKARKKELTATAG